MEAFRSIKLIWHLIVLDDSKVPTKIIDSCPAVGHKMGKCALILRTDWLIEIYVVCLVRGGVMILRGGCGGRWELGASTRGVNWSTEFSFDHSWLSIIWAGSLTHNRSMCQLIINRNSGNLQLSGRPSSAVGSFQVNLIWLRWSPGSIF